MSDLSFRAVYDAHVGYVGRLLLRFGVPHKDLEDLIQEVFVVVHRRAADFDPTRPLKPWLMGIAFRVASDWRRRAFQREDATDTLDFSTDPHSPTSGAALEARTHAHALVLRALRTLPFQQRGALVLCDLEGESPKDVAALFDVAVGTIYARLHDARIAFKAAVQTIERGSGHASKTPAAEHPHGV